jgi:hypothetical protein
MRLAEGQLRRIIREELLNELQAMGMITFV